MYTKTSARVVHACLLLAWYMTKFMESAETTQWFVKLEKYHENSERYSYSYIVWFFYLVK